MPSLFPISKSIDPGEFGKWRKEITLTTSIRIKSVVKFINRKTMPKTFSKYYSKHIISNVSTYFEYFWETRGKPTENKTLLICYSFFNNWISKQKAEFWLQLWRRKLRCQWMLWLSLSSRHSVVLQRHQVFFSFYWKEY